MSAADLIGRAADSRKTFAAMPTRSGATRSEERVCLSGLLDVA